MRAVILAAGRGTRLGPRTDTLPKPMLPVGGIPVLERNVRWLGAAGVREIAINLHHLPDRIWEHFGDGSRFGLEIRWSYEPELLGTAGALAPLAEWLSGDPTFLVVYGDNLVRCDLVALDREHRRLEAAATVAIWPRGDVSASGVAEIDERGAVVRFVEKPTRDTTASRLVNAGVLMCRPRVLDFLTGPPADFGRDVLPALIASGETVGAYRMRGEDYLEWIDTPRDLHRAEARFEAAQLS